MGVPVLADLHFSIIMCGWVRADDGCGICQDKNQKLTRSGGRLKVGF